MTLPASHHAGAGRIRLTGKRMAQHRDEAFAIHPGRQRHPRSFKKGRGQIHQQRKVIRDAAAGNGRHARACDDERHGGAKVVKVALPPGHPGHTVVAAEDDEGPVHFPGFREPVQQHAQHGIKGLDFA